MHQLTFLFNPNLCLGCRACQIACAINHDLPPGIFLRRIIDVEFQKGNQVIKYYLSSSCYHCANPECFRLCPEHAFRKRRNGTVVYDLKKCKGCGTCTRSCPFEAPVINPQTGKVIKCDLCFLERKDTTSPYCVEACPVNALQLITLQSEKFKNTPDSQFLKSLPGVPKVQLIQPSVRYFPLKLNRQIGLNIQGLKDGVFCDKKQ